MAGAFIVLAAIKMNQSEETPTPPPLPGQAARAKRFAPHHGQVGQGFRFASGFGFLRYAHMKSGWI
jgi:hypothetical protein